MDSEILTHQPTLRQRARIGRAPKVRLGTRGQLTQLLRPLITFFHLSLLTLRRLASRPALTLLSLVGIILAVALLSSSAFFSQAVDRVILMQELAELSRVTGRIPFSTRVYFFPSSRKPVTLPAAETVGQDVAGTLSGEIGLPVGYLGLTVESGSMMLLPQEGDTRYGNSSSFLETVGLTYVANIADHMETMAGDPFSEGGQSGELLEVWMHVRLAEKMGIVPGETFDIAVNVSQPRQPIVIKGLWQATDPMERFWFNDPNTNLNDALIIRRQEYIDRIQPAIAAKSGFVAWHIILDDSRLNPAYARQYAEGFERGMEVINKYLPDTRLDISALDPLKSFVLRQTTLTTTLLGFNVPALGILLAFLVLISVIVAEWQRRETSILVSRGLGLDGALGLVLVEMLLLFVVGIPLGIAAGMWIAAQMGYTVSFMAFIDREALPVSIQGLDLRLIGIALAVALFARLIPAILASRKSVVQQAREGARTIRPPFWQRIYLDFIMIVPTWYAYDQLAQRGTLAKLVEDNPDEIFQDPLLILVPALFVLTASLISLRLFPWLMRALDAIASRTRLVTPHLALRQLARYSQGYVNPLLLVVVALALGIYTYSLAASLDQWLIDRTYYSVGADITFEPFVEPSEGSEDVQGAPWIPPKDDFATLPGVEAVTRVGRYSAEIHVASGSVGGTFVGIDRLDFPQVAWFRRDFSGEPLGAMMNRLGAAPEHILVSQRFLQENLLRINDTIRIVMALDDVVDFGTEFRIAGVYDYFPTVYDDNIAIIGNLDYIFNNVGAQFPHQIWMRTTNNHFSGRFDEAESKALFTAVERFSVEAARPRDTGALIATEQGKFERVGIFGTLSVGFVAATVMAILALLLHSYASLQERLYQFGVLRAVGLRQGQVLGQVIVEYAILTACGAVAGAWIGSATAQLFAPFFRITAPQGISTQLGAPLPPLIPIINQQAIIQLAVIFALAMIVIELGIVVYALSRRLFDTLRMGHQG